MKFRRISSGVLKSNICFIDSSIIHIVREMTGSASLHRPDIGNIVLAGSTVHAVR